jgi:hypothetical protein
MVAGVAAVTEVTAVVGVAAVTEVTAAAVVAGVVAVTEVTAVVDMVALWAWEVVMPNVAHNKITALKIRFILCIRFLINTSILWEVKSAWQGKTKKRLLW